MKDGPGERGCPGRKFWVYVGRDGPASGDFPLSSSQGVISNLDRFAMALLKGSSVTVCARGDRSDSSRNLC